MDLALDNLQRFICHKIQTNKQKISFRLFAHNEMVSSVENDI